jgi:hypothetical protein
MDLINKGWHVMANHIPGYMAPPEIEGYVPDIYAIKSSKTVIVEITTIAGLDNLRVDAFKNYSLNFDGTEFSCWMVDLAGCRMTQVI